MTVRVGKFEKISKEQWDKDCGSMEKALEMCQIPLPVRATKGSAGYDLISPIDIDLEPGQSLKVPTYLKCKVDNGWFLAIFPKSGLGFKFSLRLCNTVGIIDEDYYNNESNEGHIWVKVQNDGDKAFHLDAGRAFCQGIFLPYGITYDDESEGIRKGGFGSTNA